MDRDTLEKKIAAVGDQISRDRAEAERTASAIRRSQERKRLLEARIKENSRILSDLQNRKAVQAIEGSIGRLDDARLALLVKLLNDHGDEIGREEDEGPEDGTEAE